MISFQLETMTRSAAETRALGQKIGRLLSAGMILALSGDLGSGKTCLAQGIALGLEVPDEYAITSPSYTLINEYPGRLPFCHVDLYRIENPIDFDDIGLYDIFDSGAVIALEWPDRLQPGDLTEFVSAAFEILGDTLRRIVFTGYGQAAAELLKRLAKI